MHVRWRDAASVTILLGAKINWKQCSNLFGTEIIPIHSKFQIIFTVYQKNSIIWNDPNILDENDFVPTDGSRPTQCPSGNGALEAKKQKSRAESADSEELLVAMEDETRRLMESVFWDA